jgi:hypothetical protein
MPDTTDTAAKTFTLYAPDGREWTTTSTAEATRLRMNGYSDTPPSAIPVPDAEPGEPPFDPADHTVDEVLAFLEEHPELTEEVFTSERIGKNRSTLLGS